MATLIRITGLPRSGTTVFQRLLSSDPKVYTQAETWVFPSLVSPLFCVSEVNIRTSISNSNYDLERANYCAICYIKKFIMSNTSKLVFVEKTPRNYFCAPFGVRRMAGVSVRDLIITRQPSEIVSSMINEFLRGGFRFLHAYYCDFTVGPGRLVEFSKKVKSDEIYRFEDIFDEKLSDRVYKSLRLQIHHELYDIDTKIGDKNKDRHVVKSAPRKCKGIFVKLFFNRILKNNFEGYAQRFGYTVETMEICVSDFVLGKNLVDLWWLLVFCARFILGKLAMALFRYKSSGLL